MKRPLALAAILLLLPGAARPDGWQAWRDGLRHACADRHVDWIHDGGYDEFLAAFAATLPAPERRRFDRVADTRRQCAAERIGFGCEMGRSLAAAQRLGLMQRLVAFGCRAVRCEEPALCSRFPRGSPARR